MVTQDRTIRVFISSVSDALAPYQQAVVEMCHRLGLMPVCMERFDPEQPPPLEACQREVASCDVFVLLLAHSYGVRPLGEERSYTELEYEWAISRPAMVVLAYIVDPKFPWPPHGIDRGADAEALAWFITRVTSSHVVKRFAELAAFRADIIVALRREVPTELEVPGLMKLPSILVNGRLAGRCAWSPSDDNLAVPILTQEQFATVILDRNGTEIARLNFRSRAPKWSSGGCYLALDETSYVDIVDTRTVSPLSRIFGTYSGDVRASWEPTGNHIAIVSSLTGERFSGKLSIIDVTAPDLVLLELEAGSSCDPVWLPDGGRLAVGQTTGYGINQAVKSRVTIYHLQSGKTVYVEVGHQVTGLHCHPNNEWIVISAGATLTVVDSETGSILRELEGHLDNIESAAFSPSGQFLATTSLDGTTRIWDCLSWSTLVTILDSGIAIPGAARNPEWSATISHRHETRWLSSPGDASRLRPRHVVWESKNDNLLIPAIEWAKIDTGDDYAEENAHGFHRFSINSQSIIDCAVHLRPAHYSTAKVALLGDTGVGKSGLGLALSRHKFVPTESTHARHIWSLGVEKIRGDGASADQKREVFLWDLAGQTGYRLVHQLHLRDVTIAVILFDARNEVDPLSGVRYWSRALRHVAQTAGSAPVFQKVFVVAARVDRGGPTVSIERIRSNVPELVLDRIFLTSARTGLGVAELRSTIIESIDWDALPHVISDQLFEAIKSYLLEEKEQGRLLPTMRELISTFEQSRPGGIASFELTVPVSSITSTNHEGSHASISPGRELRAAFEICIDRIASHGLVRRLTFGDIVLLQPELLDSYASAIVNQAKFEPDGLGVISINDVLCGRVNLSADERLTEGQEEQILLVATIEELLSHDIALREETEEGAQLVFPSELTAERDEDDADREVAVRISFEGPSSSVYATLVVRLSRTGRFRRTGLWRARAEFITDAGGSCGLTIEPLDEGHGLISLYYDPNASMETQVSFESYVLSHVKSRSVPDTVIATYVHRCPECLESLTDRQIIKRIERGFARIICPVCGFDNIPLRIAGQTTAALDRKARELDTFSDRAKYIETAKMTVKGKETVGEYDVFLCYNGDDKKFVYQLHDQLISEGLRPWLDNREIRPGTSWQDSLERVITQVRSAAVFVGKSGIGPWQEQEVRSLLREFIRRQAPVIPVLLPDAGSRPDLPVFLRNLSWVDFREDREEAFRALRWGITGRRI